jgi:Ca2+-binding RTX toxin-like protein
MVWAGGRLAAPMVGLAALVGAMAVAAPVGASTYTCFGQAATIVGTSGDDVLVGREDTADVIVGLGGDDIIRGAEDVNLRTAPGDRLCGGAGEDYLRGGTGGDRLQGGGGNDDVDGSYNLDLLLQGGAGNDRVSDCDSEYSGGARRIEGGPGDDTLCVDWDATEMYGGGGSDTLLDLTCRFDSRLYGGPANDSIESYFDNFDGTPCSDRAVFDDPGSDFVSGGDGSDAVVVNLGDRLAGVESVEIR